MAKERRRIIISQSIFVVGFITRAILIIVLIEGGWVDFTRDYPYKIDLPRCFVGQFIVYNVIPYSVMIYMHWKSFKKPSEKKCKAVR